MSTKRLFIYLSSHTTCSWVVFNETGVLQDIALEGNITDLNAYHSGYDITVIIPGEDVLLTKATVPKLSRQRLLQALPYMLEEQLIEDVQQLHFAIGEYQTDGTVPVAIIARQRLEVYIEALKQVGISAHTMIPATLTLPFVSHQWQIAILKDICLVRTNKDEGFACDHENLATLLTLQLATSSQKPECLQVYYFADLATPLQIPDMAINELSYIDKKPLACMGDWLNGNHSFINLLQGQYVSKQTSSLIKKIWLASGYIALAWIILLFFNHGISYVILNSALQKSELAVNAIYKKHFPNATSVVAPKERMQEKLNKFSSHANNNYVLNLLGMIGKSLHETPVIQVKQFDFRDHAVTLTVIAPSFEGLDRFSQSLKQQGLSVKQQNASIIDTEVKASLIIKAGVV